MSWAWKALLAWQSWCLKWAGWKLWSSMGATVETGAFQKLSGRWRKWRVWTTSVFKEISWGNLALTPSLLLFWWLGWTTTWPWKPCSWMRITSEDRRGNAFFASSVQCLVCESWPWARIFWVFLQRRAKSKHRSWCWASCWSDRERLSS